jgi:recombination protein RecA
MTTPSQNVETALATLRERWGGAAPRWGGEVVGALAVAPRPSDDQGYLPGVPGDLPATSDRAIPTGFRALDSILGLGGLPRAATTSLHGEGTSGKTTLALQAVAQAQAAGGIVAYLDLAGSLDPVEAVARGVQLDWLVVLTPDSLDEALAMAAMLLQDRTVDLLLLDLQTRSLGPGTEASKLAERFDRLAALARRAGVQMIVLEPPSLPRALAGVLAQVAALRLELSRRAWIRLGRDVVGQRIEVRVARDRFGPPGRAAELRILYAEGGLRDACLARGELLREGASGRLRAVGAGPAGDGSRARAALAGVAPPGGSRPSAPRTTRSSPPLHLTANPVPEHATSPSSLASPPPSPGPESSLRAIRGGADRSGRQAVDGWMGSGRESAGARTGGPTRDAARSGA